MATSVYRVERAQAIQLFGWRMIIAAVFVVATFILDGVGPAASRIGVVTGSLAALLFVGAVLVLVRPPLVAKLSATGFRLGRITRAGERAAVWTQVEQVDTIDGAMVIALRGGASSQVPLGLVHSQATALQRDVSERLNAAHGYRRLT